MFNIKDAIYVGDILNIPFDKYTPEDLLTGMNIELEHGLINSKTNVTDNDIIKTAKIALAHLNEYPNYYNKDYGLPMFENFLKQKNEWLLNHSFLFTNISDNLVILPAPKVRIKSSFLTSFSKQDTISS